MKKLFPLLFLFLITGLSLTHAAKRSDHSKLIGEWVLESEQGKEVCHPLLSIKKSSTNALTVAEIDSKGKTKTSHTVRDQSDSDFKDVKDTKPVTTKDPEKKEAKPKKEELKADKKEIKTQKKETKEEKPKPVSKEKESIEVKAEIKTQKKETEVKKVTTEITNQEKTDIKK